MGLIAPPRWTPKASSTARTTISSRGWPTSSMRTSQRCWFCASRQSASPARCATRIQGSANCFRTSTARSTATPFGRCARWNVQPMASGYSFSGEPQATPLLPPKELESQHKRNDGPGGEDAQSPADLRQRRAFEHHLAQRVVELCERQRLDERLHHVREAL